MSCSPQPPRPESPDSSDYGSDFTPDEEAVLNELLTKAVAAHAAVDPDATSNRSLTLNVNEAAVIARRNTSVTLDLDNVASLQPAALDALVADIEDIIEDTPSLRLPKVLGREKFHSLWRQGHQRPPFSMPGTVHGASLPNQGTHSDRSFGMTYLFWPFP